MREFSMDEVKEIRDKLKECKDEWLEKNAQNKPALGILTVQQILDYATGGLWDFVIEEQWREEVHKYDKGSRQYMFDGYVYHVRGYLAIQGLGRRSQYGSKVAIGGKDNQNSSYKSAASDCLKKCASLFGVGSSIYSKIKIETEEEAYNQIANNPNYATGQQPQQQQAGGPNMYGDYQEGEYVWFNNNWMHQNEYYSMKQQASQTGTGGQYPPSSSLTPEQEKQQWYYDTMKEHDPNGYQQMREQAGPSPLETMQEVDQAIASGEIQFPFNQAPAQQQVVQQEFEAQPQPEAVPQAEAKTQEFQAVEYGAPVVDQAPPAPKQPEIKKEEDPLAHIQAQNPWNTPDNVAHLEAFRQHKERLGIHKDADLLPHIREFFKSEEVGTNAITPEVLPAFNAHLEAIVV